MEASTSASQESAGYQVPSAGATESEAQEEEGSGVMVEKPEEGEAEAEVEAEVDGEGKAGIKEKVKSVVEEKIVEPVEGLVDKVKDLAVGGEFL
jgi:hypothetical protein